MPGPHNTLYKQQCHFTSNSNIRFIIFQVSLWNTNSMACIYKADIESLSRLELLILKVWSTFNNCGLCVMLWHHWLAINKVNWTFYVLNISDLKNFTFVKNVSALHFISPGYFNKIDITCFRISHCIPCMNYSGGGILWSSKIDLIFYT